MSSCECGHMSGRPSNVIPSGFRKSSEEGICLLSYPLVPILISAIPMIHSSYEVRISAGLNRRVNISGSKCLRRVSWRWHSEQQLSKAGGKLLHGRTGELGTDSIEYHCLRKYIYVGTRYRGRLHNSGMIPVTTVMRPRDTFCSFQTSKLLLQCLRRS